MNPDFPVAKVAPPAARRRIRFVHVFAALVAVLLVGQTYLAVDMYQSQLKTVEAMEQSHRLYASDAASRFDHDPRVVAFQSDPVFTSTGWNSLLQENRKALGSPGVGVWWPGLSERASAALPAVWDHDEFVTATGTVMASCLDTTLSVDQRIARWDENYGQTDNTKLKNDPVWQAKRTVMPDIFRAGIKYFCGGEGS